VKLACCYVALPVHSFLPALNSLPRHHLIGAAASARTSNSTSIGRHSRRELRPTWKKIMPPASASVPLTLVWATRARLLVTVFHFLDCLCLNRKAILIRHQLCRPQDPLNRVRSETRLLQTPLHLMGKGRLWVLLISPRTWTPQHHQSLSKLEM
jgi:hypothetical protein